MSSVWSMYVSMLSCNTILIAMLQHLRNCNLIMITHEYVLTRQPLHNGVILFTLQLVQMLSCLRECTVSDQFGRTILQRVLILFEILFQNTLPHQLMFDNIICCCNKRDLHKTRNCGMNFADALLWSCVWIYYSLCSFAHVNMCFFICSFSATASFIRCPHLFATDVRLLCLSTDHVPWLGKCLEKHFCLFLAVDSLQHYWGSLSEQIVSDSICCTSYLCM